MNKNVSILLVVLVWTVHAQKRLYRPGNITIGVLLPIHIHASIDTCGEFYSFGLGYIEAISYTISQINNDSSLLKGITLGMDVWDYCDSPVLAVSGAHKIGTNNFLNDLLTMQREDSASVFSLESHMIKANITSPIIAVLGTEDSSSTSLVSSLLQVVGITTVSPFATSEELSSPYYSTFFRTIPPDGQQAKAMVDIIEFFGWKYVAAVAVDHSYGRYGVRALERESYDRKSFCIAMVEYFTRSGYKGQVKSIVEKLKRESNIQVIVFWSNYEPARRFFEEASGQRLFGRTFLMSEALATIGKDVLERHVGVLGSSLGIIPHQYEDNGFTKHLKTLTPAATKQNPWWQEFWETEFNCSSADRSDRYKACGDSLTLGDSFEKLYNSFIPYLSDAVYAVAHALDLMIQCKGPNPSGASCLGSSLQPRDLAAYMKNVSFQGLTGNVVFSDEGNPVHSFYDIVNFRPDITNKKYSIVPVGSWEGSRDSEKLNINISLIEWNNDENLAPESTCSKVCPPGYKQTDTVACCWECLECPEGFVNPHPGYPNCTKCPVEQKANKKKTRCIDLPIVNIKWSHPMAALSVTLSAIGLVATVFAMGVFFVKRDTPIVKASNRELSFVLLVIIIMCFMLTFLHISHPNDALCLVIQPWRYITCTYCVSILYLKTNRLVSAFQTNLVPSWFKKYILDRKRQLAVVFLLNIIQIVLTTIWLVVDPPFMFKDIKPQYHIFLTCRPCSTPVGYALRAVMFAYLVFLSGLCSLYAFKARRLPENFNEAKFIGFAMYILLVSWVVYYPVDSELEGSYITFVACATALLTAYGLLGCLFVPKVYIMLAHPEQNTADIVKAEVGQFTKSFRTTPGSIHISKINRVSPTL
ncbi:hypothetical protein QZH41_019485 [Actinostola sp. cb2023]|nr:hypothetical protein QZH41_019485 [Actinostola sp. cb2023]